MYRFFIVCLLVGTPLYATSIQLPAKVVAIKKRIEMQCPSCLKQGLSPCGSPELEYGERFWQYFFRGNPPVGFFITHHMTKKEIRDGYSRIPDDALSSRILDKFADIKMLLIEENALSLHIVEPLQVGVSINKRLHECLYKTGKILGCSELCCEKDLGLMSAIYASWKDPLVPDRIWYYTYNPSQSGEANTLWSKKGFKKDIRWCLEGPAHLR